MFVEQGCSGRTRSFHRWRDEKRGKDKDFYSPGKNLRNTAKTNTHIYYIMVQMGRI